MSVTSIILNSVVAGVASQASPVQHPPVVSPTPATVVYTDRHQQAGWPQSVACWAIPSNTGTYAMYRVGGGNWIPCLAEGPCPDEGTWGWDYLGRWLRSNVILGWWHGRAYQGGSGAYRTDGPSTNHGEATSKSLFKIGR